MALIIEDGSGVSGATSYVSLEDARSLAADYGLSLPDGESEAEVSLRNGYINLNTQEPNLQGRRTNQVQTGIFPRQYVYVNCNLLANNVIPDDIKLAQVSAASAIFGGVSTNGTSSGQRLSSFNVDGVYSESYQDGSSERLNTTIQGVENAIYPYTKTAARMCGGGYGKGLGREYFSGDYL